MALDIKNERMGGRESYSSTIRKNGNQTRETVRQMERAQNTGSVKDGQAVSRTQQGDAAKGAEGAKKPDVQQDVARQQAADSGKQAAREYVNVKSRAHGLSQITNRMPAQKGDGVATRQAVAQQSPAQDAQIQRQPQQPQAAIEARPAEANPAEAMPQAPMANAQPAPKAPQGAKKGAKKGAKLPQQGAKAQGAEQLAKGAQAPGAEAAAASHAGVRIIETTATRDADVDNDDADEEPATREESTFALGKKRGRRASDGLGHLMGGSAGQGGSESGDGYAIDISKRVDVDPIPEEDPGFEIFVAGGEREVELAHKHRVFAKFVEKKLGEIAALNQEIEERINFEIESISKRLPGVEIGKIIGSVYGEGMISG